MLKQLNENELQDLHVIHQVLGQLSLAHRPVAWGGIPSNKNMRKISINSLEYLSQIHSETENIQDILSDNSLNDIISYKNQLKDAVIRADKHYATVELHPFVNDHMNIIRELLEIKLPLDL